MIAPKRAFLLAGFLTFAGCAVEVGGPATDMSYYDASGNVLYVDEAPPAPRAEVIIGVAPSPDHVWIGGYWARRAGSWVWIDGRWMLRPRPGVAWVPGHWERHPRGHVWISGHWR